MAGDQQIGFFDAGNAAHRFDIENSAPKKALAAARTSQLLTHCCVNRDVFFDPLFDKVVELLDEVCDGVRRAQRQKVSQTQICGFEHDFECRSVNFCQIGFLISVAGCSPDR